MASAKLKSILLYSTNTWLAFAINERFYNGNHYVWCTSYFDPRNGALAGCAIPPTSSPAEIYKTLKEEVARGDRHSMNIDRNRVGLNRGALVLLRQRLINKKTYGEIVSVVKSAAIPDFRPLLYVIPRAPVNGHLKPVPVDKKAHPMSEEYIIEKLSRKHFDVMEF